MDENKLEKIRSEARHILDRFGASLEIVKEKVLSVEKTESCREEGKGENCDKYFRDRMFENAPRKGHDCIIAEKGSWSK